MLNFEWLQNTKSLLPNDLLDKQTKQELPLKDIRQIKLPNPSLFVPNNKIDHKELYPYVHLENQPFDPDFIPSEQHHECYRANISPYFPRINPYYRHYMPNTQKPWMFDNCVLDFTYTVKAHDQTHAMSYDSAPFPQNTSNLDSGCVIDNRKRVKDIRTQYVNPLLK